MEVTYCNQCEFLHKRKAGSGHRYYCEKQDKWFPINYQEKDLKDDYCIDGKLPRKEHNSRCGNNEW